MVKRPLAMVQLYAGLRDCLHQYSRYTTTTPLSDIEFTHRAIVRSCDKIACGYANLGNDDLWLYWSCRAIYYGYSGLEKVGSRVQVN